MQQLSQRGALDDTTVLFIDLDGFKEVNDALGHESGDGVLRDVASRIAADVPAGVSVGRLGGDEFLAIMADADEAARGRRGAPDHRRASSSSARRSRGSRSARASGSHAGYRSESAEQLLHRADQAMYRAKAGGSGSGRLRRSRRRVAATTDARHVTRRRQPLGGPRPRTADHRGGRAACGVRSTGSIEAAASRK